MATTSTLCADKVIRIAKVWNRSHQPLPMTATIETVVWSGISGRSARVHRGQVVQGRPTRQTRRVVASRRGGRRPARSQSSGGDDPSPPPSELDAANSRAGGL
jgi:hypothetical protein